METKKSCFLPILLFLLIFTLVRKNELVFNYSNREELVETEDLINVKIDKTENKRTEILREFDKPTFFDEEYVKQSISELKRRTSKARFKGGY